MPCPALSFVWIDQSCATLCRGANRFFRVGPESIVPLCFEKSIWAVVSMRAVLKAGAAYAFLDPTHPAGRRSYLQKTLEATFVITSPRNAGLIEDCAKVIVDARFFACLTTPETPPASDVKPENACILAFTSGSTGAPKAFIHDHRSSCTGVVSNAPSQGLDSSSVRVYQWAAYTFDISITETYDPLIHGGVVRIPSEEERLNDAEECMVRKGINWAWFPPSFARVLRPGSIPGLKRLLFGGEVVTVDDVNNWVEKVPVYNSYSPAESTLWFIHPQKRDSNIVSLGKPINTLGWIVDPDDSNRLLPIGPSESSSSRILACSEVISTILTRQPKS